MRPYVLTIGIGVLVALCWFGVALADETYLEATFDDKTIDAPIGTRGPAFGEPIQVDTGIDAIVRATPFETPSLEIHNKDLAESRSVFFATASPESVGVATVVTDLWIYEVGPGWEFSIELETKNWKTLSIINIRADGSIQIEDTNGEAALIPDIPTGQPLPVLFALDMDAGTYSVWVDANQVVSDRILRDVERGFMHIRVDTGSDGAEDNRLSIDQIRVIDFVPPVATVSATWGRIRTLYRR